MTCLSAPIAFPKASHLTPPRFQSTIVVPIVDVYHKGPDLLPINTFLFFQVKETFKNIESPPRLSTKSEGNTLQSTGQSQPQTSCIDLFPWHAASLGCMIGCCCVIGRAVTQNRAEHSRSTSADSTSVGSKLFETTTTKKIHVYRTCMDF